MNSLPRVEIRTIEDLNSWLESNQSQTESVWLVSYKKHSTFYVAYSDIVDELLCFGWIDSRPAKLDIDRSMLLISPRKSSSAWSKVNKDKVERLTAEGRIQPSGQAKIDLAKQNGNWDKLNDVDALVEPQDLLDALNANDTAKQFWDKFPRSVRRGILEWIVNAKATDTRSKRISETVNLAGQNIRANNLRQPKGKT